MTVKITTPNGGADSLDFGCAQTAIVATVTGTEVSSGEGKLELKTTTGGTSAAKMTIAANGAVTLASPALSNLAINLQTATATTSGTTKDFTGIPAGVNKITVTYNGVSDNGSSVIIAQLGTSGIVTSGYVATAVYIAPSTSVTAVTAGFPMSNDAGAAAAMSGILHLVRHTGNEWVGTAMSNDETNTQVHYGVGKIALAGEVDALRFTTVSAATFDAGSVNISWEF
jgi:hypothetical protein